MEYEAIILTTRGKKVSLLSATKGRCDALLYYASAARTTNQGTLISYGEYDQKDGLYILKNPILKDLPLAWARHDIYLLHCLLELCYYFVPFGGEGEKPFCFLKNLYVQNVFFLHQKMRKMVVCKLLSLLGVCPEATKFRPVLLLLSQLAIDNLVAADLELVCEDVLNEWISWCVEEHPYGRWFKAVPFFLKVKTDE